MATVAEILERNGMRAEPSKNCSAQRICFTDSPKKICYSPTREFVSEEETAFEKKLKTHLIQKSYGDLCLECELQIHSSRNPLFHFNKF